MLKVGVYKKNQSSFDQQTKLKRISQDIWEHIAKQNNLKYKYIEVTTKWKDTVKDLNDGKYDIIVGPYIITSKKHKQVDFTIPWYIANYSIASHKEPLGRQIAMLLLRMISVFTIFIFVSLLINSFFLKYEYANELKQNLWGTLWKFTSHSTFAFFFRSFHKFKPQTTPLKIVFWFYAFFGFMFVAYVIASFVELFRNYFTSRATLPNKPTLVSANSSAIPFLRSKGGIVKEIEKDMKTSTSSSLIDVYLNNKKDYLGVFGIESSRYGKLRKNPKYKNIKFNRYNLGFASIGFILPKDSKIKRQINETLYKIRTDGSVLKIGKKHLPNRYLKNFMTTVNKKDLEKKKEEEIGK